MELVNLLSPLSEKRSPQKCCHSKQLISSCFQNHSGITMLCEG